MTNPTPHKPTLDDYDRIVHQPPADWHLSEVEVWECGCLANSADAHRVGCPDYPEGDPGWKRAWR